MPAPFSVLLADWQPPSSNPPPPAAASRNLTALARQDHLDGRLPAVLEELRRSLPASADPDMALNNLERLVAAGGPDTAELLLHEPAALAVVLQLFAASQYFSDV